MLRYKDKNGVESPLVKYENLYIEEVLDYGDKTLGFSIPKNLAGKIELEDFIRTKTDEFVIKQMNTNDNGEYDIVAKINIDELEGASFQSFETVEQTATDTANLALAGTGWTCECTVKKKRTVRMTNSSAWDVLKKIADTFILEMVIDSLNKKIIFKEKIGEDKGVYFTDELNLVSLTIQSNSSDFYTRILPLGKDGLTIESVNGGSKLLENHTYSQKNKTFIWKDERYTVPESLKEDATAKLEELATPYTSYSCKVVDLANAKKIKAYEYKIGDVITIINKETHTRIKQRIVKLKSYLENPGENTCEISNLKLTFSAYIQKYNSTCDTVDNITNDNGTVDGDAIDNIDASKVLNLDEIISKNARFEALTTQIANVTVQLNANTAKIGTLENTKLSSAEADIKYATIEKLDGVEGKFEDFYAKDFESAVSKIEDLTVGVEKVNTIMFGSASGGSLTTEFSNSVVANIGDAQIKSAMIESIAADKITSGKIYTNLVEILSESGNLDITDNTIQIKDDNKVTRVQIGKDATNDYNMYVWDKSGNLMFDALGLTESGVKREIIRNDMIKEDANIAASKLDIESLFAVINKDGSHTLKSSKIYVDANKQTLDVAFKNMTTNVTNLQNAMTTQGTQLTAVQGQISSKIWQQDITTVVNDLQIGGRNLYLGTKDFSGNWRNLPQWKVESEKYEGLTVISRYLTWNGVDKPQDVTCKAGDIFTYSLYAKTSGEDTQAVVTCPGQTNFEAIYVAVSSEWKRYTFVIQATTDGYMSPRISKTESNYVSLFICGLKLEKGNKATDWTPAPEDIDANISSVEGKITTVSNQYTSLNQSITSLTATVNSNTTAISQKADGSSVTALNNKITEITASLDGFKSTVSSSYATKTEVSSTYATQEQVADVNAKFTDYSTTVQMNSAIEQKAASITQSVSSTYATKSSLGDYATTASVTASLALKIDKTDSKQIVSMINASANEINLKSDRFSLSSSNATISKNGTVMFKAGTIGSWNITSNSLYSDYGVYRSYIQTAKSADTWVFSAQEKRNGNYYGNWYVTADGRMYSKNKVVIDSSGKDTGSYVLMETWAKSGDKYQSKTTGLEYHTYNLTNNNHSYLQPGGLWFGNKADANIRGSIALNDSNLMLTTFDIYRTKNENGIVKGWFRDTVFVMQDGWNNNAIYADWNGNFSCTGTKNRIVETENFGQVKMNAFETAGAYFADVVSGKIAADGKCVMYLDRKFAETIDRNCEYQVILTAVGKASELYVIKDEEYFTVYGQPETDFDCIVVGRQKGYVTAYADSVDFSGFEEEVSENVIN